MRALHQRITPVALLLSFMAAVLVPHDLHADTAAKDSEEEPVVRVYKEVAPATVLIASAYRPQRPLSGGQMGGVGSGVLLDEQGSILTNAHVVEGASKIMVMLHDGTRLIAEVVGSDRVSDIALLHVRLPEGSRATALLGDSDRVQVGQKVLAIGHPFGLGYALTTGVISGFGTAPNAGAGGAARGQVLQTSAAVNPGNSGGPLVDMEGRVIGITNAILMGAQNIGFAIPINTAKSIMAELRTHGYVARPWLGITGTWLPEEVMDLFALPLATGFLVEEVDEGSPAEKAGLRAGTLDVTLEGGSFVLGGDIIQVVNGHDVTRPELFAQVFKGMKTGQTIELDVLREGSHRKMSVTVQELPRTQAPKGPMKPQEKEKMELRPGGWRSETSAQWNAHVKF